METNRTLELLIRADKETDEKQRRALLLRCIGTNDPYIAYQVALRGYYVKEAQDIVAAKGDFVTLTQFATDVKGADINELGRAVAKRRSPTASLYFARTFSPTDIDDLQYSVAIATLDDIEQASIAIAFAKTIQGANIRLLEDAVISSRFGFAIYRFAKEVPGADLRRIEAALDEHNNADAALWIAQEVSLANKGALERIVLRCGSTHTAYMFAAYVSFSSRRQLMERAVKAADGSDPREATALYNFARYVLLVPSDIGWLHDKLVDTRYDFVAQRIAREFHWPGKSPKVFMVQR